MTEQQEKEVTDVIAENEIQDADLGDHEPEIGKISLVSCATGSSHPASDVSTNKGIYQNMLILSEFLNFRS